MSGMYTILGVAKDATQEDIKNAFKKKAQHLHPDKPGGDMIAFKEVKRAYDTLNDPDKRAHYDETGETNKPRKNTVEKIIANLFNQMISQNVEKGNLIDQAKESVIRKLREIDQDIVKVNAEKSKIMAMLGRVGVAKGDNLYENILNQRIEDCEHNLERIVEARIEVQEAQTLLENYEDRAPQIITPAATTFYTHTTIGGGWP